MLDYYNNMFKAFTDLFLSLFAIFASLIFVNPVFAGGSTIAILADSDGWVNESGYGRIISVYLNTEFIPCKGSEVTFKFADSKEGDYIATGSNSSTYIMQEDKSSDGCSTHAKMISKDAGERKVVVDVKNEGKGSTGTIRVDFDGKYHEDNYRDGYSYRSSVYDPYSSAKYPYLPQNLRMTQIETTIDPRIRNVHLMWDPVEGATSYNVYTSYKGKHPSVVAVSTNRYEAQTPVNSYIEVWVTAKNGELESKNSKTISLYVNADGSKNRPPELNPSPTVIYTSPADNSEVEQLNQKVQNLQNQLDESAKKQNLLEQRITAIMNWIKSIFPFFK